MTETSYDLGTIADLVHRRLAPQHVQRIQMAPKDPDRFDHYVSVRQEACQHADPILMPLTEYLDIVDSGGQPIVRCRCGQAFGDYRENWKLRALVWVRDSDEQLAQVLGAGHGYDPELVEFREYICPGCGALLDLETLPPVAPIIFDVLPDLGAFYRDWLGRELPIADSAFEDRSGAVLRQWAAESDAGGTPGR